MDTSVCMAESLHCSPEITTTLLIGYTPIQNVFGVKKLKLKKHTVFHCKVKRVEQILGNDYQPLPYLVFSLSHSLQSDSNICSGIWNFSETASFRSLCWTKNINSEMPSINIHARCKVSAKEVQLVSLEGQMQSLAGSFSELQSIQVVKQASFFDWTSTPWICLCHIFVSFLWVFVGILVSPFVPLEGHYLLWKRWH